jgi:hypothetical protein
LAGGFVIGVAALAFYIGMHFKGPGLGGSGSGDGGPAPGEATQPSTSGATESVPATGTDIAGDEAVLASTGTSTTPTPASPLVTVIISGDKFLLSTTGDEGQATPAELAEVARAALAATGDGQGIRVRIFRKKDATAGAKLDLFSKLSDAGVPSEAIQDMKEFLD